MVVGTVGDAQALEDLAVRVRLLHEEVEEHRAVLARYALVWWEGSAADRYRSLVDERRARLAALAEELTWLEDTVRALASLARAEAGSADGPGALGATGLPGVVSEAS